MAPRSPTILLDPTLRAALRSSYPVAVPLPRCAAYCHSQTRRLWLPSFPGAAALSPPQTITTRRTLPYGPSQVYALIADIDSYSAFLPYCSISRVTHWTRPDPDSQKRWPARADLTVGWGPFTESYTSRVYCVPGVVVEAVSGKAQSSIPPDVLSRHGRETRINDSISGEVKGIFESLVTRWTVQSSQDRQESRSPYNPSHTGSQDSTDVTLSVRFQFANPALGYAAGNVADEMAEKMVQAFEHRARKLYGRE